MPLFGPDIEKLKKKKNLEGLIKVSDHWDGTIRCAAARALGEIGGERAAARLAAMLTDYDEAVHDAAAQALEQMGSPAVPSLVAALNTGQIRERVRIIAVLAAIGDPRAVEALIPLMGVMQFPVSIRAVDALGDIGGERVQEAMSALVRQEKLSWRARYVLELLDEAHKLAALRPLLEDVDPAVRQTAAKILAGMR